MFHNSDEVIIRELKFYIEDREKLNIKNKSQLLCTMFLEKYGSLDPYDIYPEKYSPLTMNNFNLMKNSGWTLIVNPEEPDGSLLDHEYFCIHDDLFDRIK